MQQTPLYRAHQRAGGKIVDFAGWAMPLHYGSQIEEHNQVRQDAGVFDVSHMTIIDVQGRGAKNFLRYLLANDIAKLKPGKGLYSCMLNEQAGVIDDLIAYQMADNQYRLVVNAATRDKDLAWLQRQLDDFSVEIRERRDLAMLAIQGPNSLTKLRPLFAFDVSQLRPFHVKPVEEMMIARTGYTGEDGVEIVLPAVEAERFWNELLALNIKPCGLGARDTLRLEAGLNLYGQDMDETVNPLESNLAWTVAWDDPERNFIGRIALEKLRQQGIQRQLVGLVLAERGVLRSHQRVIAPKLGEGMITSGSFSPTLQQAIALARVPIAAKDQCLVEIRSKQLPAMIVKPPFVRHGKPAYVRIL